MSLKNIPISKSSKIRVGITIGDPSGVGPEITAKAVKKLKGLAYFVIIGDRWVFNRLRYKIPNAKDLEFIDLKNIDHKSFSFGKVRSEYGKASIEYLDKALELIRKKKIDCLVTAPICKESINKAGFHFSGHTEYLTQKTKTKHFLMLLFNKHIKIGLVTRHLPIAEVSSRITTKAICETVALAYQGMRKMFSISHPRIVVAGVNPHASDNGLIGKEENRVIKPALKRLKNLKNCVSGPLSADVAIHLAYSKKYDCVIAMYHDQALIPLKLLGEDKGVNMTLGLPFVRTSPLHGTAFDIAGKNIAKADSLIEAIKLAVKCTINLKKA